MNRLAIVRAGLHRRYRRERRFRRYGQLSVGIGLLFLALLLGTTLASGYSALQQTYIALDIALDAEHFDADLSTASLSGADYGGLIKQALRAAFPEVTQRRGKKALYRIISSGAEYDLRRHVMDDPAKIGATHRFWLLADDEVDALVKGKVNKTVPQQERRIKDQTIDWVERLTANRQVETRFNRVFFTTGDSRDPEQAGIKGAAMGSLFTISIAMLLCFPIGIAAAVYLEEFAPENRITRLIEVNINNLAAVPSIIFGLLGLAILINYFGLPRSVPLVGGMVLGLMTLPTIIISSRAALAAVPPSVREAALAVGASPVQTVLHHTMPLALPGMLTGAIIGLARALGETAPLLVIGMVAFIVDVPSSPLEPATVLPVQIYLWADSPERAFVERTSAAILVLLLFLVALNGLIVVLRNKLEKRW